MSQVNITLTKSHLFWIKMFYFVPLAIFGIMHFVFPNYFEFLVPKFVPGGILWVYFSGFALTAAGIAIIGNIIPKVAGFCLMLFVLTFIFSVDIPGVFVGQDKYRFFISFLKDMSLFAGTCLFWINASSQNNPKKDLL
ncbi:MAG: hypothetical protein GY827_09465 [Cytophagales bacterium]|nr:hypothetical protein [Cytophagales bacterium]